MSSQNLHWPKLKSVSIVVDTPGWFDPFADVLKERLEKAGHTADVFRNQAMVKEGGVAFFLSCMKLTPPKILNRNPWNFVVHASDLPKGRGFSPIVWQILEGHNHIPVTMIDMVEAADAGRICMQKTISLDGTELNAEIRSKLGETIVDMCFHTVDSTERPTFKNQVGIPTWYDRRTKDDSALDPHRTIAEQFNLLRVVDNDSYPAFFILNGQRYTLKIEKS
jgi:methionyl-tRNA formyltransferase